MRGCSSSGCPAFLSFYGCTFPKICGLCCAEFGEHEREGQGPKKQNRSRGWKRVVRAFWTIRGGKKPTKQNKTFFGGGPGSACERDCMSEQETSNTEQSAVHFPDSNALNPFSHSLRATYPARKKEVHTPRAEQNKPECVRFFRL